MFIRQSNDCYMAFLPNGILSVHVIMDNENKLYKYDICKKSFFKSILSVSKTRKYSGNGGNSIGNYILLKT